ncbi:MAG: ABC transporter permease, partial [Dehalococcoidales bacterium]|nr:ABC transporter permease [Dehalococcoidales bacterium]
MTTFIIRRLIQAVIVVILVTLAVFLVMRILPGDPLYMLYTPNQIQEFTDEQLAEIRHAAGLDRPLLVQYVTWIGGTLKGDLGRSVIHKTYVSDEVAKRLPITAHIGVLSFVIGIIIGIPIGIISAIRRGTWLDTVVTSLANIGITIPVFWLGMMLIYIFSCLLYTSPSPR